MHSTVFEIHLLTNCSQITHSASYLKFIEQCVAGGISHLQLRQKNWNKPDKIAFGKELKTILKDSQVKFMVNDDVNLTLALDADGIHLGQTDLSLDQARHILGANKLIGLSIDSDESLLQANEFNNLSYVAASAVFASPTKTNLKKLWGINGLTQFCKTSKHPVIAIGGINLNNIKDVIACKVKGIALIHAVHNSTNPRQYLLQLNQTIKDLSSGTI